MKILFLMFAFPDMSKSFNMYTTLVEEFHNNGHRVFVVGPANSGGKTKMKNESGITVLRVKTLPLKNIHNTLKGISNLLLPYQYRRALRKYFCFDNLDLIVIATPPITFVNLAVKLKEKYSSKIFLILRDIFPQNAVDMGILSSRSLVYKYFRRLEVKLYNCSDFIGCMSERNINYIINHNNVKREKIHILRNLQKKYDLTMPLNQDIKVKYKIVDKYVAVFGGNIGKPQKLENILELAKRCENMHDVVFLILGEGNQKRRLESMIRGRKLKNILLYDTIAKKDYQDLLRQCNVGLISLHEDFTIPNIPSKTLDYFNLGIPVLASIDKATDYGTILEEAGAGLWSYAGDHDKFKENFDVLYLDSELRRIKGQNGRDYFEKYLTPRAAYNSICAIIESHEN